MPTITFDALCSEHAVEPVNLVLIDAEGYDNMILRQIDFRRHRPGMVIYKHYHLDSVDRADSANRLREHGYDILEEGFDTWCLHPDFDPRLTRLWRSSDLASRDCMSTTSRHYHESSASGPAVIDAEAVRQLIRGRDRLYLFARQA